MAITRRAPTRSQKINTEVLGKSKTLYSLPKTSKPSKVTTNLPLAEDSLLNFKQDMIKTWLVTFFILFLIALAWWKFAPSTT